MSICCTVCGLWYQTESRDTLDVCPPCWRENFSGTLPPLDLHAAGARAALEAYVDSSAQMTPRQVEHIRQVEARRHLQARWALEHEED